jgi:ppGpp synthetase/RelA/SpoT-type nucleotidyltranferase
MNKQITEDFKAKRELFEAFCERIENLINELVAGSEVTPFKIESRTKSVESCEGKIRRKDKYNSLDEITDIAGVRIITYLESDVDKIADLIGSEFIVDPENSIDKRDVESNEFGYRSLHVVASLDKKREKLREYKRFKGLKFEVQIRSILQHAWAEIEHDLGYKGKFELPKSTRRNFNRLAALLETADIEFDRLTKSLNQYAENIGDEIKNKPESVELNKLSLISYVKTEFVENFDVEIIKISGSKFNPSGLSYLEGHIAKLKLFNIHTINELNEAVNKFHERTLKFTSLFFAKMDDFKRGTSSRGISLHFLCFTIVTLPENQHLIDEISYITHGFRNSESAKSLAYDIKKIAVELNAS